jgi:hypothetical protein
MVAGGLFARPVGGEMTTAECLRDLPRILKIGPYDWHVACIDDDGADELCGQAVFETNQLNFWPKHLSSPGHVVGVVLHECLHVIFDNHGLDKLKRGRAEREEAIIMGFESGLVSLFRDNPKLLTWMKRWLR